MERWQKAIVCLATALAVLAVPFAEHAPTAQAATAVIAQSAVVSITGGYNQTSEVYEQTGTAVTGTMFAFSGLEQIKSNACSQVGPAAIECTAYAGGGPPGAVLCNVVFDLSNSGNNPVITAQTGVPLNWGQFLLGTCDPAYSSLCPASSYAVASLMSLRRQPPSNFKIKKPRIIPTTSSGLNLERAMVFRWPK